jgi:hypothetical protein
MLTKEELSLRARIGAHALHAAYDARETTAKARRTFLSRFEQQVDPDGVLSPEERQKRAEHACKAYFARLALKSARARRAKAHRQKEEPPLDKAAGEV